jgi:ABC-type multidrug transport system fused ATPase/permease subunit
MSTARKILGLLTVGERRAAVVILGLMLVGTLLETLSIGAVMPAIALFMQGNIGDRYPRLRPILDALGNPSQGRLLVLGMLFLVGIYLVKVLYLGFLAWRQGKFAYGVQAHLSQRIFTTYLRQPYTFHLKRNSAELIRNTISETGGIAAALIEVMNLITECLVSTGIAALLMVVEPLGAIIVIVVLGTTASGFSRFTRSRIARWGKARQYHDGLRIQHLQQGLGGAKDVKLLGRERDFLNRYETHNKLSAQSARLQMTMQQLPRLWLELLAVSGMATLVLTMLAQGRDMTQIISAMGLFAAASYRLMPSMNRVLGAIQSIRYAGPMFSVLNEELKLSAPEPPARTGSAEGIQREIRLESVTYTYPGAHVPAVRNLSINIQKAETVGFVGTSGAGKSTLVDVILGLLEPEAGRVVVDGHDIRENMRRWQDQIGYVPQSIYLTDDTLFRNVAFGLPDEQIDEGAVVRAIKAAQLQDFVAELPQGLQTVIGERGVRLSGGQRQRIGIARALYHDPAVLVLDEATSALDTTTERGVLSAVIALHGAKTVLIVAHRLSTVEHCDRIYRLDHGSVVAEGVASSMLPVQRVV